MIRCLAGLIAALLLLTQSSLAQEPDISAAVIQGTCSEAAAETVAELQPPAVPDGVQVGAIEAQTAGTSFTAVPLSFQTLTGSDHAIAVSTGETRTACGEIGGLLDAAGGLSMVLTAAASGVGGIAYIQANPSDPSSTGVSLFVGGGILDGIDDASVAQSGADTTEAETPATPAAEAAPTKLDGGDDSSSATETELPPPSDDRGSREAPLPIDTSADIGAGWVVSVLEVNPNATELILAENQFNTPPEPGQQFFMITISATYDGPEASSELPVGNAFQVVGDLSVTYYSFDPGCGVTPNEFPRTEVFQGGSIWGTICFAINSADADSLVMFTEDFLNQSDVRVWFALR